MNDPGALTVLPLMSRLWPLPALLSWCAAWTTFLMLSALAWPSAAAVAVAACVPVLPAALTRGTLRRMALVAGFPISLLVLGMGETIPGWAWLPPLGALLLVYPPRTWRDAPIFPTAPQALQGMDRVVDLAPGARILDAGCGLGDGLRALHAVWPQAAIDGVELSRPLAWAARARCRWARVHQGDMWRTSWRGVDLVYLFQRPESMRRAWDKACAEMGAGRWLVSLEFEVPGIGAHAVRRAPGARTVYVYRLTAPNRAVLAQSRRRDADKPPRAPASRVPG